MDGREVVVVFRASKGRSTRGGVLVVLLTLFWAPAYGQTVPDKSGVKPTVLSLPSGPGSMEGLGKGFQPQLNTGTATYQVPLTLPPGTSGFAPTLTLAYDSGVGNGPLGPGWRLGGPLAIERQTEKGFPGYRDADLDGEGADVFVFGGEELVALSDGSYRLENDESFRRFSRVGSTSGGAVDSWLIEDRDGTRQWLGRHRGDGDAAVSRVGHPGLDEARASPFERTFRWVEDASEDVNGNRIDYEYRGHEDSPGVLYLARVTYHAAGVTDAYHEIELRTEARPDQLSDYRSGFERRWSRRYREISVGSQFDGARRPVRSYVLSYDPADGALSSDDVGEGAIGLGISRLHAVTRFGADRGWGGAEAPGTPLPALRFFYAPMTLEPIGAVLRSRLTALTQGARPYEPDPLAFGPVVSRLVQETGEGSVSRLFDAPLHEPAVQFADMDGDGLPDVLDTRIEPGKPGYTVARNLGAGRFEARRFVAQNPDGVDLSQHTETNQAFLSDADGDGRIDLMQIRGRTADRHTLIYCNLYSDRAGGRALGFIADPVLADGTPAAVDTTDPDVRQIDLDFDKIPDVLRSSARGLSGYMATSTGVWERPAALHARGSGTGPGWRDYRFSIDLRGGGRRRHPLVQLADVNGDRLLDFVRVLVRDRGEVEVRYRLMTGLMTWAEEETFDFANPDGSRSDGPAVLDLPGITLDRLDPNNRWDAVRLMDANGDGLSDVVFVESNQSVRIYLNAHGVAFAGPYRVAGTPVYRPGRARDPTLLRIADVNGNGSADLVFIHRGGGLREEGVEFLDFIGGQKPGLLLVADNGIGLRSHLRYKPAVADQIAAREAGHSWTSVSPVPMWVVSAIVDDIGLDLNLDGGPDRYATTFRYRDPWYDGFEKQFRGFRFVQQIAWGDDVEPRTGLPVREAPAAGHRTTVTRLRFHTGAPDGVDNDDYLDGFDTELRAAARVFDERTPRGGREEEALKGKVLLEEVVHPLALLDASADFDACARAAVVDTDPLAASWHCTPDRYVHRRKEHRWKIRRLYRPPSAVAPKGRLLRDEPSTVAAGDMTVSFPYRYKLKTTVPEANGVLRETFDHPDAPVAAAETVTLEIEYEYDDFGNVVEERNWGITGGRQPPPDDERVVRSTFALGRGASGRVERWILDRLVTRRVEDEHAAFVSEERRYYDGDPFVGLGLGQLGRRGLVSRVERRVSDRSASPLPLSWLPANIGEALPGPGDPRAAAPEWIVQERAAHDQFGNMIARADGLARLTADGALDPEQGHAVLTTFDPVFRTFPVEERLRVGAGRPDLVFRAAYVSPETEYAAAMHWGYGAMTASWNANGHRTDYLHDLHGRLTAIRSPGDSDALPSVVYTYRPADPHRGLHYDYDRTGRLQPAGTAVPVPLDGAANLVLTDRREIAGESGVFRSAAFSSGAGAELLRLEEDGDNGYAVVHAARHGLRGKPVFEAQPYRQPTLDFRVPEADVAGTDLTLDPLGRVTRRRLPTESAAPGSPRLETRVHYLPLSEWRFDEEDLFSVDPIQDHRGTPLVLDSDGLERLVGVTEHIKRGDVMEAWRTRYVHDLNDKLSGIVDSQDNLRLMRHDGLGRRIALHDVNRGLLRFVFDAAGNVIETRDAKDQRITYRYDGANRLLSEDYHDGGRSFSSGRAYDPRRPVAGDNRPDVLFTYDVPAGPIDLGAGRTVLPSNTRGFLTGVSDLSGEEHLSYDARGRVAWLVKRIDRPDGAPAVYRTVLTHDSSDRLTDVDYPDGTRLSYDYDARSRTNRIHSPQLGVILGDQTYTAAGLRADTALGNGVRTSWSYDPRQRPRAIATRAPDGAPSVLDYRYRYDGASNVLEIDDRRPSAFRTQHFDNSQRFSYDDLHRLTGADYETGHLDLAYDRVGNLTHRRFVTAAATAPDTARVAPAAAGALEPDEAAPGGIRYGGTGGAVGRIGRADERPGPQAPTADETGRDYAYDANGNLTRLGDTTLTWDFKDRVVAVESPWARAEYQYDYADRRIVKRVFNGSPGNRGPAAETLYVSEHFEVFDGQAQRYVFDGPTRLARAAEGRDLRFYHQDLVTSTDAVSDASGTLAASTAFLPFGEVRARYRLQTPPAEATAPDYLFAQKELDRETGLLFFETRHLNATLGRFVRVDPAILDLPRRALEAPQLLNGYSYAANNPLRYGDSSGLLPELPDWATTTGGGVSFMASGFAHSVTLDFHIVRDNKGNMALMITTGYGPGGSVRPSASWNVEGLFSNADTVDRLEGWGSKTGASFSGGGLNFAVEGNTGHGYKSVTAGFGGGVGYSAYVMPTYSRVLGLGSMWNALVPDWIGAPAKPRSTPSPLLNDIPEQRRAVEELEDLLSPSGDANVPYAPGKAPDTQNNLAHPF